MAFTGQDVKQLLQDALKQAQKGRNAVEKAYEETPEKTQKIHKDMSQAWVKALAGQFVEWYKGKGTEIRVFEKSESSNEPDFRLHEFLYDILVCKVGEVESSVHKKKLLFVKEALWQVESEFAHDNRSAIIDFSKLVLGSAKNKLFVASQVRKNHEESFLEVLRPAAECCTGDVYVGMIPHPGRWEDRDSKIHLWVFKKLWLYIN